MAALVFAACAGTGMTTASTSVTTTTRLPPLECHQVVTPWDPYPPDNYSTTGTRASYAWETSGCELEYEKIDVTGWVRNSATSTQTFAVRVEVLEKYSDLRLSSASVSVVDVAPGTRSKWTVKVPLKGTRDSTLTRPYNDWVFTVSVEEL